MSQRQLVVPITPVSLLYTTTCGGAPGALETTFPSCAFSSVRSHGSILASEVCVEVTCAGSTSEPQDGGFVGPLLTSCKVYALHPWLSFHSLMKTCSDQRNRVQRTRVSEWAPWAELPTALSLECSLHITCSLDLRSDEYTSIVFKPQYFGSFWFYCLSLWSSL